MPLVKAGFDRFLRENGCLPSWKEINACPYLPKARTLQDSFGGIKAVKRELGYSDTSYGSGRHRSGIASRTGKRGLAHERAVEKLLISRFGEIYVHGEKRIGDGLQRVDFYVYCPDGDFVADVFDCDDLHCFACNLNIKLRKYRRLQEVDVRLVCMNASITEADIQKYGLSKKVPLPPHVRIMTKDSFVRFLNTRGAFPDVRSHPRPPSAVESH